MLGNFVANVAVIAEGEGKGDERQDGDDYDDQ